MSENVQFAVGIVRTKNECTDQNRNGVEIVTLKSKTLTTTACK